MICDLRRVMPPLVGVATAVALAACGSGSSGTTAAGSNPSASASAVVGTTSATPPSAAAGQGAGEFCSAVKQDLAMLTGTQLSKLLADGTPAGWKAYLDSAAAMNQHLVDVAPAEVRPAVVTLQSSAQQLRAQLAAAGYDPSKVGAAKLIAIINTKARTEASHTLTSYVLTTCGVDLSKPPA